jgi:hypothetical protein
VYITKWNQEVPPDREGLAAGQELGPRKEAG